jgi:putative DNA methylase
MSKLAPTRQIFPRLESDPQTALSYDGAKSRTAKRLGYRNGPENFGQAARVPVPDFSNPKRVKTCIEVDFPIVPINALSQLEGNAGKPIYQMSKWWARRRGSVFRAMLIAAAMQAPFRKNADGHPALDADDIPLADETEAAKAVWDVYYANHQKAGTFTNLKVLDCFMGGGTTLVEGSRLGFQVAGVDLNPVAWFVVKNELACTDPEEVRVFFDKIEAEVKPVIQPFYVTECPRGHTGRWYCSTDDRLMPADFDPVALPPGGRRQYRYEGPEAIYTFWAKHGQCPRPGCSHRTPIFRSPVIAEKKLGVKYIELTCKTCKTAFHAELGAARMTPGAERIVLESEAPFTELSQAFAQRLKQYNKGAPGEMLQRAKTLYGMVESEPGLKCPKCGDFSGQYLRDVLGKHTNATRRSEIDKKHLRIRPARNAKKAVYAYLLADTDWLKGSAGVLDREELGGYADASVEATNRWYERRLDNLRFIEVRGRIKLTEDTSCIGPAETDQGSQNGTYDGQDFGQTEDADRKDYGLPRFVRLMDGRQIDTQRSTAKSVKRQLHFTCGSCGLEQPFNETLERIGHGAPVASYAIQGYCPTCNDDGQIYDGRFFTEFTQLDQRRLAASEWEWDARKETDLARYWPREEIPHSYMTHHANFALPKQGYTHWWKMFNSRQLLLHSLLLRAVCDIPGVPKDVRHQALGAVQQYLRNQNGFVFWNIQADKVEPFFSNSNYAPKTLAVENVRLRNSAVETGKTQPKGWSRDLHGHAVLGRSLHLTKLARVMRSGSLLVILLHQGRN